MRCVNAAQILGWPLVLSMQTPNNTAKAKRTNDRFKQILGHCKRGRVYVKYVNLRLKQNNPYYSEEQWNPESQQLKSFALYCTVNGSFIYA